MERLVHYNYAWTATGLIFNFGIPGNCIPHWMTLSLTSVYDTQAKIYRESDGGRIVFNGDWINGKQLFGEVWLNNSGSLHGFVKADLAYGPSPDAQILEGALVEYYYGHLAPVDPKHPVDPVIPVPPGPDAGPASVSVNTNASPLFPYIDIQGWPALSAEQQNLHFVNYPGPNPPVAGSFFDTLLTLQNASYTAPQTARVPMEQAAVEFTESSGFISNPNQLAWPVSEFARLDAVIERMAEWNPPALLAWIDHELATGGETIYTYINSPGYAAERDKAWQSWFALVMLNGGYRPDVYRMLTRTIVFCHFVETVVTAYETNNPPPGTTTSGDQHQGQNTSAGFQNTSSINQTPQNTSQTITADGTEQGKSETSDVDESTEREVTGLDPRQVVEEPGFSNKTMTGVPAENSNTSSGISETNDVQKTVAGENTASETGQGKTNDAMLVPGVPKLVRASAGIRSIESLLDASILLEVPPFPITIPLPPFSLGYAAPSEGWVVPYAVGYLKLVNKKLIGYRGTDLAHIENVMRGERRETRRRKLNRTEDLENRSESNDRNQSNVADETKSNFEEQAQRVAAEAFTTMTYTNFQSSYTSPNTFSLSGSWTRQRGNTSPAQATGAGFAEKVITKTIQQVRRKVEESRQRLQVSEAEESTSSVFDNSGGDQNLLGLYRWLSEVYEARIVQYGSRLLLEFMVTKPAANFISECRRLYGVDLEVPKTLDDYGISTYADISFAPGSKLGDALNYFNIDEWPTEPPSSRIVSVTLMAGQQNNIPLPDGYAAQTAVLTLPDNASGGTPAVPLFNGIIGKNAFTNSTVVSAPLSLDQETGSLAAVLFDILNPQPPAISGLPATTTGLGTIPPAPVLQPVTETAVSITITCTPTSETITAWQLSVFRLLKTAAVKRKEEYYYLIDTGREKRGRWLPPDLSALERRAIQGNCIEELFVVYNTLTGPPPENPTDADPGMFTIYKPVVAGFFNDAFEWNELSYLLLNTGGANSALAAPEPLPGNNLAAFLQADYARVLVPVRPAMSLSVLYFLTTGSVWLGPPELVPVTEQNIQAAFAVKTEKMDVYKSSESPPWFFEVPTSLLVLDSGTDFKTSTIFK